MKRIIKKFAQIGLKENGIKVNQKDMILLESGYNAKGGKKMYKNNNDLLNDKYILVDYALIKDSKTNKIYSIVYNNYRYLVDDVTEILK